MILFAEQPVGGALHMQHVLGMRTNAAQNAEHALHEQRRAHQAALQEMRQVVEMRDVVTLELEPRAAVRQGPEHEFDIFEGVAEHQVAGIFQRLGFPVVLEFFEAVQHGEQAEIHRPMLREATSGLKGCGRLHTLRHRHIGRAAGGQVHHGVGRLLDARQEAGKGFRRLVGLAGHRIAGMQMDHGGSGLGGADRGLGDFLRRHRQIGRHGGCVDRPGHGAGDDDLVVQAHGEIFLIV